jgi:enamine deaminase RidA (YjgF/YER057c/UK114 family)
MSGPEKRLAELGIELPAVPEPAGLYLPAKRVGNTMYVSGHVPMGLDPSIKVIGQVGLDLTVAEGQEAARRTGLAMLASLRRELGTLDRITDIVKVFGMVKCGPGFTHTFEVINGCSALLAEVFGERGRHARSAVGVAELPFGMAVEIEMIVEVA